MAPAAVEAEFAIMDVVRLMTVGTSAPQPRLRGERPPMTGVALNVQMSTLQRKVCLPVVVELPLQPVHRVVAQGAVFREATRMRVAVVMAFGTLRRCIAKNVGLVARVALFVRVCAEQWKPRQAVIEEDLVGPRVFVMAVEAGRALGTLVRVVFLVAREAVGLRFDLEDRLDMTGLAFDQFMSTLQRVLGVYIMVEVNRGPGIAGVACLTGRSEMAFVVVVFEMAGDARDVHFVVERVLVVAVTAGQLRVPSFEGEARVARVIELGIGPAGRCVAVSAFLSAAAIVRIVFGMAVETCRRRCLEGLVFMATGAFGFRMFADQ